MPDTTEYLKLEKPFETENYSINVFNRNTDKLDGELKKQNTSLSNKANCYNKIFTSGAITDIILANPKGSFRVDPGVTGMPRDTHWIVTTFTGLDSYLFAVANSLTNTDRYTIAYNQGSAPKFSEWSEIPIPQTGIWNPTLRGVTTAGTPVYTATGTYYKLGNLIIASAYILVSTAGGMAGEMTIIGGLPFAVKTKFASGVNYRNLPPAVTAYSNSTNAATTNIYLFAIPKDGTDFDVHAIYERS